MVDLCCLVQPQINQQTITNLKTRVQPEYYFRFNTWENYFTLFPRSYVKPKSTCVKSVDFNEMQSVQFYKESRMKTVYMCAWDVNPDETTNCSERVSHAEEKQLHFSFLFLVLLGGMSYYWTLTHRCNLAEQRKGHSERKKSFTDMAYACP